MKKILLIPTIIFLLKIAIAHPFQLQITLKNQPESFILMGKIKGDKFDFTDSLFAENKTKTFSYSFPENATTGMYRLLLGQTTYAKVMNEPPQQLDFIFNNENITLETDFKAPEANLNVLKSVENRVWFEFLKSEEKFREELKLAEMELEYYRPGVNTGKADIQKNDAVTSKASLWENRITQYNDLQKQRDSLIQETIKKYPELFASKLIKMYSEPFLDGNLTKEARNRKFQQDFLKLYDFSNESLMNSPVYTEKIFSYLMSYAQHGLTRQQQEQEFKKATDVILANTRQNEKVYEFILDYLVRGFEKLQLENLITYIAENYAGTTCQTDEVTTLERKLLQQKMKPGTTVPDFTLQDINDDPVTLSDFLTNRNLILFWASWCPHCLEILPELKNYLESEEMAGFEVFAVSLDTSKTEWYSKVYELGIENWLNLSDLQEWDGPVTTGYNVYATPTLFLIDKNRKILAKPLTLKELFLYLRSNQ